MKNILLKIFLAAPVLFFMLSCSSQINTKHPQLKQIEFKLGHCNGICPKIEIRIDSNGKINVSREFYLSKSEVDSTKSGNFEGTLSKKELTELKSLLTKSKYWEIIIPDVYVVDLSMIDLMIDDSKQQKQFRFLEPDEQLKPLTNFLTDIARNKELKKKY
jgi:hypothetical protein